MAAPEYFYYLNQSDTFDADGINDHEEFADVKRAMEVCGIDPKDQQNILQIAAGILHLGNIQFYEDNNSAIVNDENSLAYPAYLVCSH